MKKFWKYFTLTILFLLGLCCVGVLYLFFVPNSSLFGICYISYHHYQNSENYKMENVSTIKLNSNSYNVNLVSSEEDKVYIKVYSNSFGFSTTNKKHTKITSSIEEGTLTFNVTEPTGALLKNSSYIEIYIPESKSFNLSLTNNKAKTTLNDNSIQIENLNYKTNNGDFIVNAASISNNICLELNKATFEISKDVSTNNNDVTIKLTSGKFNAKNSAFKNIKIESNTRGVIIAKSCESIQQQTDSAGGRIEIETVSNATIKSSSTNVYFGKVLNGTIIELKNGDISINEITRTSYLVTDSGKINVNTSNSYLELKTNSGDITVSNAKDDVSVDTKHGTVNITFAENALSKFLTACLTDGKLISSGLNKINLVVSDNGRAELNMADIKGESSIKGNNGSIFIKVNKLSSYKLVTKSEGIVRVNLAQIPQFGGYTTKEEVTTYVNCTSSSYNNDVLDVSTKAGSLTILDSNFA